MTNTSNKPTKDIMPMVRPDGAVVCGSKRYFSQNDTLRQEILRIMGRSDKAVLLKSSYLSELITAHIPPRLRLAGPGAVADEQYKRRRNNVEKALSRLRHDLSRIFSDLMPPGTAWLCFSKKIDGWLLYRLPGLGCDGEYHW